MGNPAGPNSGTPNAIWAVSLPQTLVGNPHGRSEIHFSLHTHLFKDEQPFFQAFTSRDCLSVDKQFYSVLVLRRSADSSAVTQLRSVWWCVTRPLTTIYRYTVFFVARMSRAISEYRPLSIVRTVKIKTIVLFNCLLWFDYQFLILLNQLIMCQKVEAHSTFRWFWKESKH